MPRDFQCENRTSLTHCTQFLYASLLAYFWLKRKKANGKSLIAPIVAVSEEMGADGTLVVNGVMIIMECDGNLDSNEDPSARIIVTYLFFL